MNRIAIPSTLVAGPAVVCLAFLALLAVPSAVSAQQRRVPIEEDNHAFRFIFNSLGMEPLTDVDQWNKNPADTIVIVFGDNREVLNKLNEQELKNFIEKGGAVLIATDRPTSQEFSKVFGVQITGQFVKTSPESGYLGKAECPFVVPLTESNISKELFGGPNGTLEAIATNRPSLMVVRLDQMEQLASLRVTVEFLGKEVLTRWPSPFAAGAEIGDGRVLILADHSVFINSMMLQPNNDNFAFAYNCIDWLREGKEGKRTQVLFYDDNETVPDFKVPIKTINEFPVPPVEVVNHLLANLENENIFNRLILGRNPERTFRLILRALAVALTVGLVLVGMYWLLQNRHRIEVKAPLFAKTAARLAPEPAVVALRHEALIKEDNFWEVGRDLARDWFADHYGSRSRPRIKARISWWKRRALTQKVNELWKLAYGPPRKLSARHFARVVADLEQVEAAWNNESLRWIE